MRFLAFAIAALLALFVVQPFALAAPATVDTSTSAQATANSAQRKTFFDTQHEVHWAFYYNGAAIEYSYSADGVAWTSAGTLAYNTASFSAVYKSIGGTSFVFVVAEANTHDVVLRRGELGADSVTFDAEQTVFDGSGASDRYTKPTVAVSDNNHLWFSSIKDFGAGTVERLQVKVRRSSNQAGGDLSMLEAETPVGAGVQALGEAVIMPQNGDGMYLISSTQESNIVGYTFDGADWSSANTGGDYSWFGFGSSGLGSNVRAIAVSGSDLYVGGEFVNAGGVVGANFVAKWDGNAWSAVGSGGDINFYVYKLVFFGSDLYVGGWFQNAAGIAEADYVAKWDGNVWSALGSNGAGDGAITDVVQALTFFGNDLYVGGQFQNAGGVVQADRIAKWDGNTWSALGNDGDLGSNVNAIAVLGSDLYVGGGFQNAAGIATADRIAKWNGNAWSALGSNGAGNGALSATVYALAVLGSDLYVGGGFQNAGGIATADRIAKWDGAVWSALGSNGAGDGALSNQVNALVFSGSDLYVGGFFSNAAGIAEADTVAKWDGNAWSALGSNGAGNGALASIVSALAVSGSDLYVGGTFQAGAGPVDVSKIARWDGANWNAIDRGGVSNIVNVIVISGSDLYAGGAFRNAGGVAEADYLAMWDGNVWRALGNNGAGNGALNSQVRSLVVSGSDLYVGGYFENAAGIAEADRVAIWDGNAWSSLGSDGAGNGALGATVHSLAIEGSDLYVGGEFTNAALLAEADYIAMWDGNTWNALGSNGAGNGALAGNVNRLAVAGSDLYVGGNFQNAAGIAVADRIAKWDGSAWSALGSNGAGDGALDNQVSALAVAGSDLYVGGWFQDAAGIAEADRVAKWDGNAWSGLGSDGAGNGALGNIVYTLAVSGSDVYVGGFFQNAAGIAAADGIARWDGVSWNALELNGSQVNTIAISDSIVYVGGAELNITGSNKLSNLAYYYPAIADDAGANTEISAVSGNDGNVTLSYINENEALRFRRFDENAASWEDTVTLNAAASSSPSLSYRTTGGRVTASWVEGNAVKYSYASAPYEVGDWAATKTLYNTGTNFTVVTPAQQASDLLPLVWSNGVGAPYSVLADVLNMAVPTVAISSSASSITSQSPFPITVTFSKDVTGFVIGDISVGNGTVGNFVAVDDKVYTAEITPTVDGLVTVDIAAGVAEDEFASDNTAATQLTRTYDPTAPTVAITSSAASPTQTSPIPVAFEFSEPVTGFAVGDVVVGNGTAGSFVAVDGDTYTASITPISAGVVTVDVSAAVASDLASNSNTAAAQFSITYEVVEADVDTDGDGVSDNQEAIDETNQLDSGSYLAVLPTYWCSDWNGFFGMYNINEYVNLTNGDRVVVPTLFDIQGEAKSSLGLDLLAGTQTDLLVHGMRDWTVDSYGKVCSEVMGAQPGDVDGRMVYYKPSLATDGYDFAFALPYYDGLKGRQFLTFNTMQPSGDWRDGANIVVNWVQLINLEETVQSGTLYFYRQDGSVISEQAVNLAAEARQDFSVHEIANSQVGIIEWRPTSNAAKFGLRNTRYYYDNPGTINSFDAALQLEGARGSGELLVTLLDTRNQTAVLEVANTTGSTITAEVRIYDAAGSAKHDEVLTLAPYASLHIVANQYLNEEQGSATVNGSAIGSVLAVGMNYGKNEEGGITHIYGQIAKQSLGTTVHGSYNTYLGQSCELLLANSTGSDVSSTIRMKRLDGTTVLSGVDVTTRSFGTSTFDVCVQDQADHYGVMTVEADTKNAITPVLIRSGAGGDYKFVTPLR